MGLFDFLGGGKAPSVDTSQLTREAKAGAQRQREIATGARAELAPLAGQFATSTGEATTRAAARRKALAGKFLQDVGKGQKALGTAQFNQAKQQILGEIPELQRAAREGAAATGGLKRGAAAMAIQAPVQQAQEQLGGVAGDIAIQSQATQNQAFNQIFQGDQAFDLERLGIDQNVAKTLMDTGRTDILQEALQLAGVEGQLITDLLGIEQMRMESDAARSLASSQRRSALTGALLGVGGQVAGGFAGRK